MSDKPTNNVVARDDEDDFNSAREYINEVTRIAVDEYVSQGDGEEPLTVFALAERYEHVPEDPNRFPAFRTSFDIMTDGVNHRILGMTCSRDPDNVSAIRTIAEAADQLSVMFDAYAACLRDAIDDWMDAEVNADNKKEGAPSTESNPKETPTNG